MTKTTKILIGVIIFLAAGLATVAVIRFSTSEDTWLCQNEQWIKHGNPSTPAPITKCEAFLAATSTPITTIEETRTAGLIVFTPRQNEITSSPLTITGQITGKQNWIAFEGQVGTVKLVSENGITLASGILKATTNWMQLPVNFQTILTFDTSKIIGFDAKIGQTAKLVFNNENPSGDPARNATYDSLQIKINGTSNNQMTVSVFFPNNKLDPNMTDCSKVFRTTRTINKTTAVGRAALEELFKGPTDQEKNDGFSSSIPTGVKIQSLTIENGVAKVDLNKNLEQQVGGSCRIASIYAEINQTLKQFSTVKTVIISIDGRTENILQP